MNEHKTSTSQFFKSANLDLSGTILLYISSSYKELGTSITKSAVYRLPHMLSMPDNEAVTSAYSMH